MALDDLAQEQYLYLTTTGRTTWLLREIEIWFVLHDGRFYLCAEHGHAAQWVKNIVQQPRVQVRVGTETLAATARPLDPVADADTYQTVQHLMQAKYGWGAGLPVQITPLVPPP